jgi:ABC-type dipeptide/oligopeptide/nickel transport system permease subunit
MMRVRLARWLLALIFAAALAADLLAPRPYDAQFRDSPDARPSRHFLLGTDELGRDRFSRLLYGTRLSLLLAPAAAALATALSALVGLAAAASGRWGERGVLAVTDLVLSLPWLFLLLAVRALLPLNLAPLASVIITFALLGLLGWAPAARVLHAGIRALHQSDFVLHARASGSRPCRLMAVHILPNLVPLLRAQFWILVPAFLLTEANLGLLGLGVSEPLPSWGNLLRELENVAAVPSHPWLLVPVLLLILVVGCLHLAFPSGERAA